jgi:predicted ThiF/HesA family dinucleotide-utilizing enzyme
MITADRLHLHAGDKIVVFNGGGTMGVTLSAIEYYNPTRGNS